MTKVVFWDGWAVDGDFLLDSYGNHYHKDEIRAIFFTRQLVNELTGTTLAVRSMKAHLERKLQQVARPKIQAVIFEGGIYAKVEEK